MDPADLDRLAVGRIDFGPADGPLRAHLCGHALRVLGGPDPLILVGVAMGGRPHPDPAGGDPVYAFRINAGKADLPGLFVADRRRVVPLDDWLRLGG